MEYVKATEKDLEDISILVKATIQEIYPQYYPKEVVDFFCKLHCKKNIFEDIKSGFVGILRADNMIVGTGCCKDNHITRVYVKTECQGKGYGTYIMQCLENQIRLQYDTVYLDASLPASHLYEKRGYQTTKHEKWIVENGRILVYEVMVKSLPKSVTNICYDGKFFVPQRNTQNGEVDGNTVFEYHQKENMLWADYAGGDIIKGHLIGTVTENGELDFCYLHINKQKQVRTGVCHSVPHMLDNGKIELSEKWQWLNGDKSEGKSVVVEI